MVLRATDFISKGKVLERKKGIFDFQKHGFKYQKAKPEGSEHRFLYCKPECAQELALSRSPNR